ncbi:16S rRNA (guanine(527)-N(7))-methyltransferase RsmG [Pseudonocardia sp. HH130630-07]|uniref:16S rRNA (guanine(527)-N(7))-methyltransferase RsmG n=1 Tax=Pseudonocardia sp. HH130630-07 TaxID=1690815 RepID=UPI000814F0BC|nr:16S rRNA (guanine(527)-N(7))-methyltransferase RsmG [Pseudonocardia sp. HH130630-07]ANY06763.1 16S rRNA (guanine(527)-N(7))-methyltransferase RsmG [Pseudonocardia sp. HH130630-07]
MSDQLPIPTPETVEKVFGERAAAAARYVGHLATSGIERGLIGPRERDRLWDRHVLNCAVLAEVVPPDAKVVDVGSGAGLPGIPLALARPDLQIVLVEPLARRVDWLDEVLADLGLDLAVERGRAEEPSVLRRWEGADVVTARAVGPLARLAGLSLPLLRPGGVMLVLKGASAPEEIVRDAAAVRALGGGTPTIHEVGAGVVEPLTRVVEIPRIGAPRPTRRKERR